MTRAALQVGLNLPWIDCGHDFGEEPPAWGGQARAGRHTGLGQRLAAERAAGLELLRFWVLGGGKNYPVGERPGARLDVIRSPRGGSRTIGGLSGARADDLHFALPPGARPPALTPAFLDDFDSMLSEIGAAGMKAWPVLLSFEAFFPIEFQGGVLGQGRGPLILGRAMGDRGSAESVAAFLDEVLEPLLQVCARHREHVAAVELVNEPDWVVQGGPVHARLHAGRPRVMPKTVAAAAMERLLRAGVRRVRAHGLVASIGFKQADPRWISSAFGRELREAGAAGEYLHQLHYYPSLYEPGRLPRHETLPIQPCIVGELPTRRFPLLGPRAMAWLDEPRRLQAHLDPQRYLGERLALIERRGFPAALLWSRESDDEMCAWGPAQRRQVGSFVGR